MTSAERSAMSPLEAAVWATRYERSASIREADDCVTALREARKSERFAEFKATCTCVHAPEEHAWTVNRRGTTCHVKGCECEAVRP